MSYSDEHSYWWFYVVAFVLIIALTGGCGALVDERKAVTAAEDAGYTNVEVIDKAIWFVGFRQCDKNDNARFTVRGVNPRNQVRTFYVCAGTFKGGTIRSR